MKLLILALSCNLKKYLDEEDIIRRTWGKDIDIGMYPDIDYYFFRSSEQYGIDRNQKVIYVKCGDTLKETAQKTNKVFFVAIKQFDFDYVLLTNCSTFLNLKLINNFINSEFIDKDKIYTGEFFAPLQMTSFIRGNFILLSKKYAEYIISKNIICDNANDVDISIKLMMYFQYHDKFLDSIREVESIKKLDIYNEKMLDKSFYIYLKRNGDDSDIEKDSEILYEKLSKIETIKFSPELVFPIKYVTTVRGIFKIEKIG